MNREVSNVTLNFFKQENLLVNLRNVDFTYRYIYLKLLILRFLSIWFAILLSAVKFHIILISPKDVTQLSRDVTRLSQRCNNVIVKM